MSTKKNLKAAKAARAASHGKSRSKLWLAIAVIAIVIIAVGAYAAIKLPPADNVPTSTPTPTSTSTPTATPAVTPLASNTEYSNSSTKVLLHTSAGDITIELRNDKPITTANFLNLTQKGIYDNTIFHRVIAGFMIQGGDPTGTGHGSPSIANIPDEIGNDNHNYNGTIAMANTGQPNSASSQFFINVADNNNLYSSFDTSYTVFGKVISGMNVVMAISNVPTDANDKPLQNVTLISVTVIS